MGGSGLLCSQVQLKNQLSIIDDRCSIIYTYTFVYIYLDMNIYINMYTYTSGEAHEAKGRPLGLGP